MVTQPTPPDFENGALTAQIRWAIEQAVELFEQRLNRRLDQFQTEMRGLFDAHAHATPKLYQMCKCGSWIF